MNNLWWSAWAGGAAAGWHVPLSPPYLGISGLVRDHSRTDMEQGVRKYLQELSSRSSNSNNAEKNTDWNYGLSMAKRGYIF